MLTKVCTTMEANRADAYDFSDTSVWGVTDNMTSLGINIDWYSDIPAMCAHLISGKPSQFMSA